MVDERGWMNAGPNPGSRIWPRQGKVKGKRVIQLSLP